MRTTTARVAEGQLLQQTSALKKLPVSASTIETKLVPAMLPPKDQPEGPLEPTKNHTAEPQDFVTLIVATVKRYEMQERVEVQSFDFRTLKLVEEQAPTLPTYYLTGNSRTFPIRSATE